LTLLFVGKTTTFFLQEQAVTEKVRKARHETISPSWMTEHGPRRLTVAGRTIALLHGIVVNREPGRVDPKFDEVSDADVLFENGMRNLEVFGVLGVHCDAVHQVVAVGEVLLAEL